MPIALVRPVPESFADCVTARPPDPPLDPGRARRQHEAYRAALAAGGFDVVEVAAAPDHPDSPFVEDTAVVLGDRALVTRPGHPSRRGEVEAVTKTLAAHLEIVRMEAPATLDGGDVLQVGDRVFAGLSTRTNAAGIEVLTDLCGAVTAIPVERVLHLKSAATAVDDETVLVHRPSLDISGFGGLRILDAPGDDPEAANVVWLPDGSILVAEHHPATADLLGGLGHRVTSVDVSEFARADGGLTCLSIRIRRDPRLGAPGPVVSGAMSDTESTERPGGDGQAPHPEGSGTHFEAPKLMRIASMTRAMLDELRQAPLDDAGRRRLVEIHERSLDEMQEVLSEDLRQELVDMFVPLDGEDVSEAELRVAQAQLVGWLEGLFAGIQATLWSQQAAAAHQLQQMRMRAIEAQSSAGEGPPGQYL